MAKTRRSKEVGPKIVWEKGECHIGLFKDKYILMRLVLIEGFVNMISKYSYFIKVVDGYPIE